MIMAAIALAMHHAGVSVSFDTAFQAPMMLAFFTTVGLRGSLSVLWRCRAALLAYLAACWGMAAFQNLMGSAMATLLGVDPALGAMVGATSLMGDHGVASAVSSHAVAAASATYGLIAGGLLGGPVISVIINRRKIAPNTAGGQLPSGSRLPLGSKFSIRSLPNTLATVLVIMALGRAVNPAWAAEGGVPDYVVAMLLAAAFRSVNDLLNLVALDDLVVEVISRASVGLFLMMAMMRLHVWELYALAAPLLAILMLQTAAIILAAAFVLFPILGGDYDAAVMCSGFIGHGMGAAPNAISNMNSVCESYDAASQRAFLIVGLCGAGLGDVIARLSPG
jgi:ESS family glutamate:Na+ symporter